MTILDDVHKILVEDYNIQNLYIGEAPVGVEDCTWVVSDPSTTPNPSIGYYEQFISVWSRFRKTEDAYTALQEIFDAVHQKSAYSTQNYFIYLSVSTGLIEDMGRDIESRKLLRLSIKYIYRQ